MNELPNCAQSDYLLHTLDLKDLNSNPFVQFSKWLEDAYEAKIPEPNAMTLATVGKDRRPSARIVLLRGAGQDGFRFYTNYVSKKGEDLEVNPACALVFYWPELERQIRIEAQVAKLSSSDSDLYFAQRPLENRLAAWASQQSTVIASRKVIEDKFREFERKFGENVPRPPYWGGYIAIPEKYEFWQGRKGRMHDRFQYDRPSDHKWNLQRLAP